MRNKELFKMWMWELRESGEVGLEENLAKEFRDYLDKIQFPYYVEWETSTDLNGHKTEICYIQIKEG
jgi:hypothetical protein